MLIIFIRRICNNIFHPSTSSPIIIMLVVASSPEKDPNPYSREYVKLLKEH